MGQNVKFPNGIGGPQGFDRMCYLGHVATAAWLRFCVFGAGGPFSPFLQPAAWGAAVLWKPLQFAARLVGLVLRLSLIF